MAQSHDLTSVWWPVERIKATLDTKYIVGRLRPELVPRLFDLPRWGEGLTSETYMEWILLKAGRLFLILDAIGIPDRIFALVDESCDDDDLPVAEQNINQLALSPDGNDPALNAKFFHAQWRFLVRGIAEGEHVTYSTNEGVPVEVVHTPNNSSRGLHGRDDTVDQVILAGSVCKVYMRTQVQVGGAPHFFSSSEVLGEIRALRKLAHQHVISIYASYFVDDNVCVLFTGAETDRTLYSFLTDEPLAFKRLSKEQRRQTMITWPHCMVSALAWLHARGHSHGAIRPSNITVDANYHIRLGQFQALDSVLAPPRVNDLESYQYSAPERWVRVALPVQQPSAPSRTLLPSGGRTARKKKPARLALTPLNESPPLSPDFLRPDSAASKGTVIRIGLPGSPSRFSFAFSSSSSSSSSAASSTGNSEASPNLTKSYRNPLWGWKPKPIVSAPSITPSISTTSTSTSTYTSTSKSTSNSSATSASSIISQPITTSSTTPSHHTPFTTWQSHQTNPTASDLFSLAAIILDILTHLCKRSLSSFASHRSARNRSAGRGGGMADASFHLPRNAVQVQSWIALLEGDALKRCRRDRGSDRVFWAVPRMLIVLRAMLASEPEKRPAARRVVKSFAAAIKEIPVSKGEGLAVALHCTPLEKGEVRREKEEPKKTESEAERQKERVRVGQEDVVSTAREGTILSSSSVSEFDFGFSDAGGESETDGEEPGEEDDEPSLLGENETEAGADILLPVIQVEQVSPQLVLPDFDVNITGIDGLTFRE